MSTKIRLTSLLLAMLMIASIVGNLSMLEVKAEEVTGDGASQGLSFSLNSDEKSYTLVGIGSCNDTTVVIPDTYEGYPVTVIGTSAFTKVTTFKNVIIPNSVTTIQNSAFYGTNITAIEIPASVTSIGSEAFSYCSLLETMLVDEDNPIYHSAGNCIVETESKTLVAGCKTSKIPADGSVTVIGSYAFRGCSALTSVVIPEGVTTIKNNAFANCTKLAEISLPSSLTNINTKAFAACSALSLITYNGTTAQWDSVEKQTAWNDNTSVSNPICTDTKYSEGLELALDDSGNYTVIGIGECTDTELIIPSFYEGVRVTAIAKEAFKENRSITSVYIPATVTSIESNAFWGCINLTAVYTDSIVAWCKIKFGSFFANPVYYADNLYINGVLAENITIPNVISSVSSYAFTGCDSIKSVTMKSGSSIGYGAFQHCKNLSSVNISGSKITSIGAQAFLDCPSLTYFNFPSNLKTIGARAFRGTSLISISIPKSITSIGEGAFASNSALSTIKVDSANTTFIAVNNCLINVKTGTLVAVAGDFTIPADGSVTAIGGYTFEDSKISWVAIPNTVVSIGKSAFSNCIDLASIVIPASVTNIGSNAFASCTNLTKFEYNGTPEQWEAVTKESYWNDGSSFEVSFLGEHKHKFGGWMPVEKEGSDHHYRMCECGVTEVTAHTWSPADIITPPTAASEGSRYYSCYICGSSIVRSIPVLDAEQTYAEGLTYSLNGDGVSYTVTGIGTCKDSYITIPAYYNGYPVTIIGSGAFSKTKVTIKGVSIPDTVKIIETNAFSSSSIAHIYIPASVLDIQMGAFSYCNSLQSIEVDPDNGIYYSAGNCIITRSGKNLIAGCNYSEIPEGAVAVIEEKAFYGMSKMVEIKIPEGVKGINDFAFGYCTGLDFVSIPASVINIGLNPWQGCQNITKFEVVLGNKRFTVNGNCLIDTDMNMIVSGSNYSSIPDGVAVIGDYSFYNASKLASVNIPNSVYHIGVSAFYNCDSLTTVIIPASVKNLYNGAFGGCNLLTTCFYAGTAAEWDSMFREATWNHNSAFTDVTFSSSVSGSNGLAYALNSDNTYTVIGLGDCQETDVIIPALYNGLPVASIAENAFLERGITSINIPSTITFIGAQAFRSCKSLQAVYIDNLAAWCGIEFDTNQSNPLNAAGNLFLNGELVVDLVFPSNVTTVKSYAFYNCTSIKTVDASSVSSFGSIVFSGCRNLEFIKLSTKLSSIPKSTFNGCKALTSITIPTSVKTIGDYAFQGTGITSLIIPANVNSIGFLAFSNMSSLTHFEVAATSKYFRFDNNCLIQTSNKTLNYAFPGAVIPTDGSVTAIGVYAFSNSSITSIVIPNTVVSIGSYAFRNSSLKSIVIPASVTKIDSYAFANCKSLTSFVYEGSEQQWEDVTKGKEWNQNATFTVSFGGVAEPSGELAFALNEDGKSYSVTGIGTFTGSDIVIPATYKDLPVTAVAELAFNGTNITSVYIPSSVKFIGSDAFALKQTMDAIYVDSIEGWLDIVFENISAVPINYAKNFYVNGEILTDLVIPSTVTKINDYAFIGCRSLVTVDASSACVIGVSAFEGCINLKSVILNQNMTEISRFAFADCISLKSIDIPNTVETIAYAAFCGSGLESFHVSANVTLIDAQALSGVKNITVDAANTRYVVVDNCLIGIDNKSLLTAWGDFVIPADGSVIMIASGAFYNSDIISIDIPDKVISIASQAFYNCTNLKTVKLPSGLQSISSYSFYGCKNLTGISIPENVTYIGTYAFRNCTSLAEIKLPSKLTSIGSYAFYGCSSLTYIEIPSSVNSIGNSAFRNCAKLTEVKLPSKLTNIGTYAFYGCSNLKSIVIPSNVTSIQAYAFYNCSSLSSVTVPAGVTLIDKNAFANCKNLTSFIYEGTEEQWASVAKPGGWNSNSPFKVVCTGTGEIHKHVIVFVPFVAPTCTTMGNIEYWYCNGCEGVWIDEALSIMSNRNAVLIGAGHVLEHVPAKAPTVFINGNIAHFRCIKCDWMETEDGIATNRLAVTIPKLEGEIVGSEGLAYQLNEDNSGYTVTGIGSCTASDIVIPATYNGLPVTAIASRAFINDELTSVYIPSSIKFIGTNAFSTKIDTLEAVYTDSLEAWCDIVFESANANPVYVAGMLYINGDLLTNLVIPSTVTKLNDYAFYYCDCIVSVDASSVTSLGDYVFYGCSGIESVTLNPELTFIAPYAFANCFNLSSIELPAKLNGIGAYAFSRAGLTSLYIPNSVMSIGDLGLSGLKNIKVDADNTRYAVVNNCFIDIANKSVLVAWGNFAIPADGSVTSIGPGAFYYSRIIGINIPNTITSIGNYAFYYCSTLKSINLPDSITSIGAYAFYYCTDLTEITIPEGIKSIGNYTFYRCSNLTKVVLPESLTSIGNYAFRDCSKLTNIYLPANVNSLGNYVFYGCSNLQSIVIPTNVTRLMPYAFNNCTGLTSVTIPAGMTLIDKNAFGNCKSISSFIYKGTEEQWNSVKKNGGWNQNCSFTVTFDTVADHEHEIVKVEAKEATCYVAGNVEHWSCLICKAVWLDADLSISSSLDMVQISAGHMYYFVPAVAPTEYTNGNIAYFYCWNCDWMMTEDGVATNRLAVILPSLSGEILPSEGLEYQLNADGSAYTVMGIGTFTGTEIVIPDTYNGIIVTAINNRAFYDNNNITSVVLGANINTIGAAAFWNCGYLKSITLSGNLVTIGEYAFTYTGIKTLHIPGNVRTIGEAAFQSTCGLNSITVDKNNNYFVAINDCLINLKSQQIIIAGNNCVIPTDGSAKSIGYGAFSDKIIKSIVIPNTIEYIADDAFNGCDRLTSVTISDSVLEIGSAAFANCPAIKSFVYEGTEAQWNAITKAENWDIYSDITVTFKGSAEHKHTLVHVLATAATCTEYGNIEYWYCSDCDWVEVAGGKASNLLAVKLAPAHSLVYVAAKEPTTYEDGNIEYYYCKNCDWMQTAEGHATNRLAVILPATSPDGNLAFTLNAEGTAYSVSGIGSYTKTDVVIPSTYRGLPVTAIAANAFKMSNITSIYIPSSITLMERGAFTSCQSLKAVYIDSLEDWCKIHFENYSSNPTNRTANLYVGGELLTNLVIPSSVTSLNAYAFYRVESLVSVDASSLVEIGANAFSQCFDLKSVNLGSKLISIGSDAFSSCESLTEINLPESLEYISDEAFIYTDLRSVVIPANVSRIGEAVFAGAYNLESIYVAPGNKYYKIVDGCLIDIENKTLVFGTKDCTIPADGSVTAIGGRAFASSSITSIVIPDTIVSIGWSAFDSCYGLTSVTIPYGVTEIKNYTFSYCQGLISVTIPTSVKTISYGAFSSCNMLSYLIYEGSEEEWNSIEKMDSWNENTDFIVYFNGKVPEVSGELEFKLNADGNAYTAVGIGTYNGIDLVIPETYNGLPVTEIADMAFAQAKIVSVYIPSSIKRIGYDAFFECNALTSVYIDDIAVWCGIKFNDPSQNPLSLGDYTDARSVKLYVAGELLEHLVIPSNVTTISDYAFYNCEHLLSVDASSVTYFGNAVFANCSNLVSVSLSSELTFIPSSMFSGCVSLRSIVIPESVRTIGSHAFYNTAIETIHIPANVASLNSAFIDMPYLKSIIVDKDNTTFKVIDNCLINVKAKYLEFVWGDFIIPNDRSIITIGYQVFSGSDIESIVIPYGVEDIDYNAFYNCDSLTSVVIPMSVKNIYSYAFAYCASDIVITYMGTEAQWNEIYKDKYWDRNSNITVIFTNEHKHELVRVEAVVPTCNSEGNIEYWYCMNCDWVELEGGIPTNLIAVKLPKAHNLTYVPAKAPTETEDGNLEYWYCNNCTWMELAGGIETNKTAVNIPAVGPDGALAYELNADGKSYSVVGIGSYKKRDVVIPAYYNKLPVTAIADEAFRDCRITSVSIPSTVKTIGSRAFQYTELTSVLIPAKVSKIGNAAFSGMFYLKSIAVESGNKYYEAVDGCLIDIKNKTLIAATDKCTIPADGRVTVIGPSVFSNSEISNIVIPDTVVTISGSAFFNCNNLTKVTIPSSVTHIGNSAFAYSHSLTIVTIPTSVTYIGHAAFSGCENLLYVIYEGSEEEWAKIQKESNWNQETTFTVCFDGKLPEATGELEFTLNNKGTEYTVSGIGTFTGLEAIIPATYNGLPVTAIGAYAFQNAQIISISIPATIKRIDYDAFLGCNSLKDVYIEDIAAWCAVDLSGTTSNPMYRGANLYVGGELVTNLVIPSGVTSIPYCAFSNCRSIVSVDLGNVTEIGYDAFYLCENLERVIMSSALTTIFDSAFSNCSSLTSIALPDSLTYIGSYAFENTAIESLHIPAMIKDIGDGAFSGMFTLKSMTIDKNNRYFKVVDNCLIDVENKTLLAVWSDFVLPNDRSITTITGGVFRGSDISSIVIPYGIKTIGRNAFSECNNLTSIVIPMSVQYIDSYAFSWGADNVIITYMGSEEQWNAITKDERWNYSTNITIIFTSEHKHEMVYAPAADPTCENEGNIEYYYCLNCEHVELADGTVTNFESVIIPKAHVFVYVPMKAPTLEADGNIEYYCCEKCGLMQTADGKITDEFSVIIPAITGEFDFVLNADGTAYAVVGMGTYSGTYLYIPESYKGLPVIAIGYMAFRNAEITGIYIPSTIKMIDGSAFRNCKQLVDVYIDSLEAWFDIDFFDLNSNPLRYAENLYVGGKLLTDLVVPESVTVIKPYAFYGYQGLVSVVNTNSVAYIGQEAFSSCENLKSVTFGSNIETIGMFAFAYCENLTNVSFSGALTSMERNVFYSCRSLESIELPDTLKTIGAYCFMYTAIENITIPANVSKIGASAFGAISNLKNIYIAAGNNCFKVVDGCLIDIEGKTLIVGMDNCTIPTDGSVNTIGAYAFCESKITSIVIPKSVVTIEYAAFIDCWYLTEVTIPVSVKYIGSEAFTYCESLKTIIYEGNENQWNSIEKEEYWDSDIEYTLICTGPEVHEHELVRVEAKAPTCYEEGNIEYWYCTSCDWVEVEGGVASNLLAVKLPVAHAVTYIPAKAPTFTECGNIEYWYCYNCGCAWLDKACTIFTNLKFVEIPMLSEYSPTITVAGGKAAIGETVQINVSLENVIGFSYMKAYLTYTSGLTLVSIDNNTDLEFNFGEAMIWNGDHDWCKDGLVLTLTFKVDENAKAGNYSVEIKFVEAYDTNLHGVYFVSNAGTVEVTTVHEHSWSNWEFVDADNHQRFCQTCGESETVAHCVGKWSYLNSDEHHRVCVYCEAELVQDHIWGEWTVTASGSHLRTCIICGAQEEGEHQFGSWTNVNSSENHQRTCSVCEVVETSAHVFSNWASDGFDSHRRICKECGATQTASHSYGEWIATADGHYRICEVCGSREDGAHSYSSFTATEDGKHTRACTVCGNIESGAHSFGKPVSLNGMTHQITCAACGATENGVHSFGDWTSVDGTTHQRICTDGCGATEIGAHRFGEWSYVDGEKHQIVCADGCGATQTAAHSYGNWIADGENHKRECAGCGAIEVESHSYGEWIAIEDNKHAHSCVVCGTVESAAHSFKTVSVNNEIHKIECVDCGTYETASHNFSNWISDGESHKRTCADCGTTVTASHIYGNYSDTTNGVEHKRECAVCGNVSTETHTYGDYTYLNDTAHKRVCTKCDASILAEHSGTLVDSGAEGHTLTCDYCGVSITSAHVYTVYTSVDDEKHSSKCDYCDNVGEFMHNITEEIVTAPTTSESGSKNISCKCGFHKEGVEIPKYTVGDATGDGNVDIEDIENALQHIINSKYENTDKDVAVGDGEQFSVNEFAVDVNGDGAVDATDIALLLQYLAGWDVELRG